jgi:hypothetical protein
MFPAEWGPVSEPLRNSTDIHRLLRRWRDALSAQSDPSDQPDQPEPDKALP